MKHNFCLYLACAIVSWGCAIACVPIAATSGSTQDASYVESKHFRAENYNYEPGIRTVLFYPSTDGLTDVLDIPVLFLNTEKKLKLEFDELGEKYYNYYFRLVHCNADWSVSGYNDIDILSDYNEFIMDNYELSLNTRKPYVHYMLTIPKVKASGNYVVMVYRNGNKEDIVLTRRFMVYDNKVTITPKIGVSSGVAERFTHQQVDFQVRYGGFQLINPQQQVSVVVRQNARWDNALYKLKPMFLREEDAMLDYSFFNLENNFKGGNEFRSVDLRSVRFNGQNVARTHFDNTAAEVWLLPDKPRNKQAYAQIIDINGRLVIENYETKRGATEADYVYTNFSFDVAAQTEGNIYVFGQLTDWKLDKNFLMTYDEAAKQYKLRVPLKQGFYNYEYVYKPNGGSPIEEYFEGSFFATENQYEIFVYYRPIGARADQLIGYSITKYMGR